MRSSRPTVLMRWPDRRSLAIATSPPHSAAGFGCPATVEPALWKESMLGTVVWVLSLHDTWRGGESSSRRTQGVSKVPTYQLPHHQQLARQAIAEPANRGQSDWRRHHPIGLARSRRARCAAAALKCLRLIAGHDRRRRARRLRRPRCLLPAPRTVRARDRCTGRDELTRAETPIADRSKRGDSPRWLNPRPSRHHASPVHDRAPFWCFFVPQPQQILQTVPRRLPPKHDAVLQIAQVRVHQFDRRLRLCALDAIHDAFRLVVFARRIARRLVQRRDQRAARSATRSPAGSAAGSGCAPVPRGAGESRWPGASTRAGRSCA